MNAPSNERIAMLDAALEHSRAAARSYLGVTSAAERTRLAFDQVNELFQRNVIVINAAKRARVEVGQMVTVIGPITGGPYAGFIDIEEGGPLRPDEIAALGSLDADMAIRFGDVR